MKRDRTQRKKKLTLRERLTRRKTHRLAAHVSREDQWDYDVPNIRLSRAFVVVVVLHIVAVGGILAFEVLKPDGRGSVALSDDPKGTIGDELVNSIPEGVKVGDPRAEGKVAYIVRAGDTVKSIADRFGLMPETIERQNGLDRGGRIYPGRQMFIPKTDEIIAEAEIAAVATAGAGGASSGTVAGSSQSRQEMPTERKAVSELQQVLSSEPEIARAPVVSAREVEPEPVRPRYAVTESPAPTPASKPEPKPVRPVSGTDGGVHTMARGETPFAIARRYGVKVDQLLKANGISDPTNIQIGQKLKIPGRR
ncbi:MAG: LysM peptidoglycan-binding domain-containing protein [Verrucomicrobiae bacterium]|nr:LysM peptidoglycan-binding domain-containing protein [Verrucomicrobiae bacterium]